jgi:hypothetical protein
MQRIGDKKAKNWKGGRWVEMGGTEGKKNELRLEIDRLKQFLFR